MMAVVQVPILVSGRLVSWIDSKAMFGDDRTHRRERPSRCRRS